MVFCKISEIGTFRMQVTFLLATLAYCVDNLKKKSDSDTGMYSCNELKKLVIENKFRNASKEPLTISKGDFGVMELLFQSK